MFSRFANSSLNIDVVMGKPAYKPLVYEFFASFTITHGERMFDENSKWQFRIQNMDFCWTIKEATKNIGLSRNWIPASTTPEQQFVFWKRLTGVNHYVSYSSPYSINCDGWRHIHRLVETNINCQSETMDYVLEEDLNIMWNKKNRWIGSLSS